MDSNAVIIKPLVTEKSTHLQNTRNSYAFQVAPGANKHQIKDAIDQSLAPGSQTFEQALFYLYSSGKITLDEALAYSDSPTNLHWLINNAKGPIKPPAEEEITAKRPDDLSNIKLNLDALG